METLSPDKQTLRILFLASSPKNQGNIRLGTELQEIRDRLAKNPSFEIKDRQAVKPDDVLQTILNYKPHIVHFSGHGQENGEICFEDEKGDSKTIPPDALASLFKLVSDYVKCVVINTCFSEVQAKAISQFIPIVIGTSKEITDGAAIKFSTGFYTALDPDLSQKSLHKAFDSGCIAIRFENLPSNLEPVIIEGSPEIRFTSEVDNAFLSITEPNGVIFKTLKRGLSLVGNKMGVSEDVVSRIIEEKIKKLTLHNESIAEYEMTLLDMLRDEYPFSETANSALYRLQIGLDLSNQDVEAVKSRILSDPALDKAESWFDRGIRQSRIKNNEKAIEYFSKAIEKDNDYSAAFYEKGYCYDILAKFDLAIEEFTKAINFDNKWEVGNLGLAYYSRARAYDFLETDDIALLKEHKMASLSDWTKSIEINPDDANAYYGRALVYGKLNRLEEAIVDLEKSYNMTKNEKQKRNVIIEMNRCYFRLKNFDEAEKWAKLLDQNPEVNLN